MPKKRIGLNERQREVAELLAQRYSIKEIANQLGITAPAVNMHIRILKDELSAETHREIVAALGLVSAQTLPAGNYTKPISRFSYLHDAAKAGHSPSGNDPGLITFADAGAFGLQSAQSNDWAEVFEPRIVPKWLDGDHAVLMRLTAIAALLFAMLLLPVIGVATLTSISNIIGS